MASEVKPAETKPGAEPQQRRLDVDDAGVLATYTNFCRVTGTPEEVLIDFGLNAHPFGQAPEPIKVTQRIVLNYYTAKRMLAALQLTVQRHEAAFGVLETDVQKRVRTGVPTGAPAAAKGAGK